MIHPTPEQLAALDRYREGRGPTWKSKLRRHWLEDSRIADASLLRQLRNNFGPNWLNAYRIGDTKIGYPQRARMEIPNGRPGYNWLWAWKIVDMDGVDLIQPYSLSKADMRLVARQCGITLIERTTL
jgi:hypothetical protein